MSNHKLLLELEEDLILLRKNHGFTLLRFNNLTSLPKHLGDKNQTFAEKKDIFRQSLSLLSDKQANNALLVAYGLRCGYDEIPLLKERRRKYSKEVKLHTDTLLVCENYGISELARILTLNKNK